MSLELRPNLHAAGLAVDVLRAIEKRVRGKARKIRRDMFDDELKSMIINFVENVDDHVNGMVEACSKKKSAQDEIVKEGKT